MSCQQPTPALEQRIADLRREVADVERTVAEVAEIAQRLAWTILRADLDPSTRREIRAIIRRLDTIKSGRTS